MKLNLIANTEEEKVLLAYLEENASEPLAEKINNGVPAEKDGKHLISKKTLTGFLSFACEEAKKQVEQGAKSAAILDRVVFGWAIHYFEEDSIVEKLYNADGTEYEPPRPKYEPKEIAKPIQKPKPNQLSLFDEPEAQQEEIEEQAEEVDEEEQDVEKTPVSASNSINYETGEIIEDRELSVILAMFGDYVEIRQ